MLHETNIYIYACVPIINFMQKYIIGRKALQILIQTFFINELLAKPKFLHGSTNLGEGWIINGQSQEKNESLGSQQMRRSPTHLFLLFFSKRFTRQPYCLIFSLKPTLLTLQK